MNDVAWTLWLSKLNPQSLDLRYWRGSRCRWHCELLAKKDYGPAGPRSREVGTDGRAAARRIIKAGAEVLPLDLIPTNRLLRLSWGVQPEADQREPCA